MYIVCVFWLLPCWLFGARSNCIWSDLWIAKLLRNDSRYVRLCSVTQITNGRAVCYSLSAYICKSSTTLPIQSTALGKGGKIVDKVIGVMWILYWIRLYSYTHLWSQA